MLHSHEDSDDSVTKILRKQTKRACVNCQKAAKRCDEGRPCQRCITHNLQDTCVTAERKERTPRKKTPEIGKESRARSPKPVVKKAVAGRLPEKTGKVSLKTIQRELEKNQTIQRISEEKKRMLLFLCRIEKATLDQGRYVDLSKRFEERTPTTKELVDIWMNSLQPSLETMRGKRKTRNLSLASLDSTTRISPGTCEIKKLKYRLEEIAKNGYKIK